MILVGHDFTLVWLGYAAAQFACVISPPRSRWVSLFLVGFALAVAGASAIWGPK